MSLKVMAMGSLFVVRRTWELRKEWCWGRFWQGWSPGRNGAGGGFGRGLENRTQKHMMGVGKYLENANTRACVNSQRIGGSVGFLGMGQGGGCNKDPAAHCGDECFIQMPLLRETGTPVACDACIFTMSNKTISSVTKKKQANMPGL